MLVKHLLRLSQILTSQHYFQEAQLKVQEAIALQPDNAEAHNHLGFILENQGKLAEAEAAVREALGLKPDFADAHKHLSFLLGNQGKLAEAAAAAKEALKLNPNDAQTRRNLSIIQKYQNSPGQKMPVAKLGKPSKLASQKLKDASDYNSLGFTFWKQNKLVEAEVILREALRLQPDYPEAYNTLGAILFSLGKLAEAEKAARKVIASRPDYPEAYTNLGAILHNQGRLSESEAALIHAIALKPNYAEAHKNLGVVLKNQGKLAEAEAAFRDAIACQPNYAEVYKHLGELKKYSDPKGDIAAMEKLLSQSGTASQESMNLCFALGKAYEDIGNYDRAFDYFSKGNQLKRQSLNFNIANVETYVNRTIEVFTKSLFAKYNQVGLASDLPILIVGMPRSGTTLVEQILASHPQVYGAGELPYLNQMTNKLARALSVEVKGLKLHFPESMTKINASKQLQKAGELYIKALRKHDAEARYITDKMPDNSFRIGVLHLMLPQVKIIHCLRNPADTCLSCYQKLFAQGQSFSYDLKDLGRYYQLYHRMMQHWHAVLPGQILKVQYEDVVASQEEKAREILDFCGIEWDDACLNFYQSDRTVKTASAAQVRQPIYTTSVQRWRRYERQLAPLLEALGPLAPVVE